MNDDHFGSTILYGLLFAIVSVGPISGLPQDGPLLPRPDAPIVEWIDTLASNDSAAVHAATLVIRDRADEAIPVLVERSQALAKAVERDTAGTMRTLLATLEELAPTHEQLWPVLVELPSMLRVGPGWAAYSESDPAAATAIWKGVREAAGKALGATGPRCLAELARLAVIGEDSSHKGLAIWSFRPHERDIPAILALMRTVDERSAIWIAWALSTTRDAGAQAVAAELGSGDRGRVLTALRAARSFTPEREMLAPIITGFLEREDAEVRYWSCFALGSMIPTSLPALFRACEDGDVHVRLCAVEAIEKSISTHGIDPSSPEYGNYASWHGLFTTARLRSDAQPLLATEGVAVLASRLADVDENIRVLAALGLYKLGERAAAAQSALDQCSADPSSLVRYWTQQALRRIGLPPRELLVRLWENEGGHVRAAKGLSDEEVDALARDLDHPEVWEPEPAGWLKWPKGTDHRWNAVVALARETLPDLLRDANGSEPGRSLRARQLLDKMERELDARIRTLLRLLDDELEFGGPAAVAFVGLGPVALPALEHDLLRYPRFPLGSPTYGELSWVLEALGNAALPILTEGLEHWNEWGRAWAAQALLKLGDRALPAVPALISAWRAGADDVRLPGTDAQWDRDGTIFGSVGNDFYGVGDSATARGPGGMGPAAVARLGVGAVPWLVRGLSDMHATVRARSANALAAFGVAAEAAFPRLVELLDDQDCVLRAAAARGVLATSPNHPAASRARSLLDSTPR